MKDTPILMTATNVRATLEDLKTQTRRMVKPQPLPDPARFTRFDEWGWTPESNSGKTGIFLPSHYRCPYGGTGDQLWVKETWQLFSWDFEDAVQGIRYRADGKCDYQAMSADFDPDAEWLLKQVKKLEAIPGAQWMRGDEPTDDPDERSRLKWPKAKQAWNPSIFMPRWVSRIALEVVSVRVEKLQDISRGDAIAEGIRYLDDMGGWAYDDEGSGFHGGDPLRSYENLWISINGAEAWNANPWVWVIAFRRIEA